MTAEMKNMLLEFAEQCQPASAPWDAIEARIIADGKADKFRWSDRHKRLTGLAGAAVLVGGMYGAASLSPVVAIALDKAPGVNQVYDWFGDPGLNRAVAFDNKMHHTASDRGIQFTITDAYYDQDRLSLQYRIDLPDRMIGSSPAAPEFDCYMNGEKLDLQGGGACGSASETAWQGMWEMYPNGALPNDFTLQVAIHKIGGVAGNWLLQVPVSRDKTQANTKVVDLNLSKAQGDVTFSINRVTVTPASVIVDYEYNWKPGQLGGIDLLIYDRENGEYLRPVSGGPVSERHTVGSMQTVEAAALFDAPKQLPSSLYVIPEKQSVPDLTKNQAFLAPLNQTMPFTLDEGVLGQIAVNHVDYVSDKTVVTLSYHGPLPYPMFFGLQKPNGVPIDPLTGPVSNGNGQFTITYPSLEPTDKAEFTSAHYDSTDFMTDFAMQVPLN